MITMVQLSRDASRRAGARGERAGAEGRGNLLPRAVRAHQVVADGDTAEAAVSAILSRHRAGGADRWRPRRAACAARVPESAVPVAALSAVASTGFALAAPFRVITRADAERARPASSPVRGGALWRVGRAVGRGIDAPIDRRAMARRTAVGREHASPSARALRAGAA